MSLTMLAMIRGMIESQFRGVTRPRGCNFYELPDDDELLESQVCLARPPDCIRLTRRSSIDDTFAEYSPRHAALCQLHD